MVAADEFLLGFGKIERKAIGLREHRDEENHERNQHGDPEKNPLKRKSGNECAKDALDVCG